MTIESIEIYKEVIGKVCLETKLNRENNQLSFYFADGDMWCMNHKQDCCESVEITEIHGELSDLLNVPLLMAESITHESERMPENLMYDSETWTFYRFATIKGYVTIRWCGRSNGYYSERVSFFKAIL